MRILYALSAMFPYGRAYAVRTLNLCRSLKAAGHEVYILADYISDKKYLCGIGKAEFDGLQIFLSSSHCANERTLFDKVYAPTRSTKTLKRRLVECKPDCVIISSAFDRYAKWIKILKKNHLPIILESCEWFDYYNFKFGKYDLRFYKFLSFWKRSHTEVNGVIAISRLLEETYSCKGLPVIRVPGLCDPNDIFFGKEVQKHDKIRLVFIGEIVCSKDNISETINAILFAGLCEKVEFHIFGPSQGDLEKQLGGKLPDFVIAHGFVDQDQIKSYLREMDFGIIIRPYRRSSNAGFPTKLVEYMSQGLPVIANITGDIGLYLKNNENGYIVSDNDHLNIAEVLDKIIKEYNTAYANLCKNALNTAKSFFDYHVYSEKLNDFIKKITTGK